jgi:hypothetical protein
VLLLACILAVAMPGCRKNDADARLVDLAVKVETDSARIQQLSLAVEGMNRRLSVLEQSMQDLKRASASGGETTPLSAGAPNPNAEQVRRLSEQVAILTGELLTTREELASARGDVEKIGTKLAVPQAGNIEERLLELAGKPDRFVEMLDALAASISPTIQDAGTRANFEAEIALLRDRALYPPSPQELFDEFRGRHIEKLNAVTDEKDKRAVENAIAELDNASENVLQKRLDRYGRERMMEELSRIVKQDGLRGEDVLPVVFKYIKED